MKEENQDSRDPFEELQEELGGSLQGAYDKAVGIVMKMVVFLEKNTLTPEDKMEEIRNCIRCAKYCEAIELAQKCYKTYYLQAHSISDEQEILTKRILFEERERKILELAREESCEGREGCGRSIEGCGSQTCPEYKEEDDLRRGCFD